MKKSTQAIFLLLLGSICISSCNFGFHTAGGGKGYVNFEVSRLSPALIASVSSGSRSLEAQSKTFLVADKVTFNLALLDEPGGTWAWDVLPGVVNSPTAPAVSRKLLEPGTYSVVVDIYNASNEASLQHTATGSEVFVVTAGQVAEVRISCSVVSSVALTEGIDSASYSLPVPFSYTGTGSEAVITEPGSERWFSFTASKARSRVQLIPTETTSEALLTVAPFLIDGHYLGEGLNLFATAVQQTLDFTITTVPGQLCYLGVMDAGDDAAVDRSFMVRVDPAPDEVLPLDGAWSPKRLIFPATEMWYYYDVPAGSSTRVSWADGGDGGESLGTGVQVADVTVTAYMGPYGSLTRGTIVKVEATESGFTTPISIATDGMYRIWVKVAAVSGGFFTIQAANTPLVAFNSAATLYSTNDFGVGTLHLAGTATDGDGWGDIAQVVIRCAALDFEYPISSALLTGSGNDALWSTDIPFDPSLDAGDYLFTVQATDTTDFLSSIAETTVHLVDLVVGIE